MLLFAHIHRLERCEQSFCNFYFQLKKSVRCRCILGFPKAGRIRYSVRPGKKATVYEMISMKEEGIVTGFLSGNSAAIAVDMSDSEGKRILQNEDQNIL